MTYKLVASDFDDTLLRSDDTVSDDTLSVIRRFRERGGVFAVVTGRMTSSILKHARRNGLEGLLVGFGGAHIVDIATGETVYESLLDARAAARVAREFEAQGLQVQIYLGPDLYVNRVNEYTALYAKVCETVPIEVGEPVSDYLERTNRRPYKVLAFQEPDQVLGEVARINRAYPELFACFSKPEFIEVSNRDTNKAHALQMLADRYGIPIEEVIAVGDSNNDVPMLAYAGLGAAVANARPEARQAADLVLPDTNDEDAVAHLIERFCLKED